MSSLKRKKWISIGVGILLALLSIIYFRNTWYYHTNWAYDGGAHVNYIWDIATEGHLPLPQENYLAWHEPLYYVLHAGLVYVLLPIFDREGIITILEILSAFYGILFVLGAGVLSYLVYQRRILAIWVMMSCGFLYIVSAASRYVTNEIFFHAAVIWWLILFFYWRMHDCRNWNFWKWFLLSLLLAVLVWIKLTGLIIVFALIIWFSLQAFWSGELPQSAETRSYFHRLGQRARLIFLPLTLIIVTVTVLYSPWLWYKQQVYGQAFTINNYETEVSTHMPKNFFLHWSGEIFDYPFWTSGRSSFWSMFVASTVIDYDNVFENYDVWQERKMLKTVDGRWMSVQVFSRSVLLLMWSVPLFLFAFLGFILWAIRAIGNKLKNKDFLLGIIASGFFFALVYNVWRYPMIGRGTLKALFILSFFPLLFSLAGKAWLDNIAKCKYKNTILLVFWLYMLSWCMLSASLIILPSA